MKYRLEIRPGVYKALARIAAPTRARIEQRIETLADNPRPADTKKLKSRDYWRIRVGDYRVVYRIEDEVLVVLVVRVGHRKDVYRGLEG